MNSEEMMSIERLRERAAQCRQFAWKARSRGIATELEKLAYDCDRDAARLEVLGLDRMTALVQ